MAKRILLYAWPLWMGIETTGDPMWTESGATFPSRDECHKGAEFSADEWVRRMKAQGRAPQRMGADGITRLEGGSIALVHFVCLPDTTHPRQKR
jgi:hypothetical protein